MAEWILLDRGEICGFPKRARAFQVFTQVKWTHGDKDGEERLSLWWPRGAVFNRADGLYAPEELIIKKEEELAREHGWDLASITYNANHGL